MSDFLLELGKNPNARKLIRGLGLPLPMPQALRRTEEPYSPRPLADRLVAVGAGPRPGLLAPLARTLARAGAEPRLVGVDAAPFEGPGEAWARPAAPLDEAPAGRAIDALLFDGSGVRTVAELGALHEFFHPHVGRLARSGRALVLARPPVSLDGAEASACQRALEGFTRSLAKEIGRRGATAHVVYVDEGAEGRLPALLAFLLSPRSAFLSGQPFWVTMDAAPADGTDDDAAWARPLEERVALVTGAARGIGAATATRLAREGAKVVVLDRPEEDAPVSQLARAIGGPPLLQDIGAPDAPSAIADALEALGGVDVVVHNAGVTRDRTLAKMPRERWDLTLDVNLAAIARVDARLRKQGVLRDGGRVLCLSSVAGIAGNLGQTNYAASKAGVVGYVEALAVELAPRGVTVNAVAPGFIETRMTARIPPMIREAGRRLSNLGQGGLPGDVADLLTFLASGGSQGLTGQTLRVCGGALIGA